MTGEPPEVATRPLFSLTQEPGAANPRLRMVLRGRVDGHAVADAFIALYAEQPAVTGYDRLFDLTGYRSGFELEHLKRIAPAYLAAAPDPGIPSRTAFVTRDPNFGLWVQSMGYQFTGREFAAFATSAEAEDYLAVPLEARRRAPAG